MTSYDLFSFRPAQVTLWTTFIYLALLVPIVYIQSTVPGAPDASVLPRGINLSEAWTDLGNLTQHFHPANSPANDITRSFILYRIREILDGNGIAWTLHTDRSRSTASSTATDSFGGAVPSTSAPQAVVFDDLRSNVTFSKGVVGGKRSAMHFEGTNVYVYIRGSDDEAGDWWMTPTQSSSTEKRIVLVNAHFDSVPSSYGATDDGVGVVTALQLIRFFTMPAQQPLRGIIVLLNNAEEDYLLGASAFVNSPFAPFIGTFVNLEGAGAGGRAILFRSTDLEVMGAYRGSPHPFGSVFTSDSFKAGLIRSETDYRVWVNTLGYRGIDLAFYSPRARYHTPQDDRKHTSRDSVWHMLSAALTSVKGLSEAAGDQVDSSKTDGVWFDIFGKSMILFPLRGLFAWSLAVLIVSPLVFAFVLFLLYKMDRDYMFRSSVTAGPGQNAEKVPIGGWKGFFRFPLALSVSGAVLYGTAFLLREAQPFIIHSSLYAILSLMFTLFYVVFWFIMRSADFVRPSAFHRTYALFWLSILAWALLVFTAVVEDRDRIASGYIIAFWSSGVFVGFLVSLLEMFALRRKMEFIEISDAASEQSDRDIARDSDAIPDLGLRAVIDAPEVHDSSEDTTLPTEASPLLGSNTQGMRPTTFATRYRRSAAAFLGQNRSTTSSTSRLQPFGLEQQWSGYLPNWTWLLQFVALGPCTILLTAQLGLALITAVQQTGTDGSNPLMPYLLIALFTVLLLLPITPFLHRITCHIPLFFLAVFAGTLVYSLSAFPFSASSPYKFFIRQTFSEDTGNTSTILTGHKDYLDKIISDLPSAAGKDRLCSPANGRVTGLVDCIYDATGVEPRVNGTRGPFLGYSGLISVNITGWAMGNKATLEIDAVKSKSCTIRFERPVKDIFVHNSLGWDTRFEPPPEDGNWMIADMSLWRRDWVTPWIVDVEWMIDTEELQASVGGQEDRFSIVKSRVEHRPMSLSGLVVCGWADASTPGAVPAVEEAWKYAPKWSIASIKSNPPLVQGSKNFSV